MEAIEENQSLLKTTYAAAKALGEKVNHSRDVSSLLCLRDIEAHDFL